MLSTHRYYLVLSGVRYAREDFSVFAYLNFRRRLAFELHRVFFALKMAVAVFEVLVNLEHFANVGKLARVGQIR